MEWTFELRSVNACCAIPKYLKLSFGVTRPQGVQRNICIEATRICIKVVREAVWASKNLIGARNEENFGSAVCIIFAVSKCWACRSSEQILKWTFYVVNRFGGFSVKWSTCSHSASNISRGPMLVETKKKLLHRAVLLKICLSLLSCKNTSEMRFVSLANKNHFADSGRNELQSALEVNLRLAHCW